jgi:hypothetical protein
MYKYYSEFGFIIIRHINNNKTNQYWKHSCKKIKEIYNCPIVIIDDNSDKKYVSTLESCNNKFDISNIYIIDSEFHGRGELLPYYYLWKYKFFNKAIIIHDSVFIQKKINIKLENINDIKFIWTFIHKWNKPQNEIELIKKLKNNIIDTTISYYNNKKKWSGCFGVQSIICLNFLELIQEKYNLFNLLNYIKTRNNRMSLERIFGLICCIETNKKNLSIYNTIHQHMGWGLKWEQYIKNIKKFNKNKDIVKVWSGR